jgi:hypothetical protein
LTPDALKKLKVEIPPFGLKLTDMLHPSLWFGTSLTPTPFHHDSSDNFVQMIAGTKNWTLSPPLDWRYSARFCTAGLHCTCTRGCSQPR